MLNEKDDRKIHFSDHNKWLRFMLYSASHSNPIRYLDGDNVLFFLISFYYLFYCLILFFYFLLFIFFYVSISYILYTYMFYDILLVFIFLFNPNFYSVEKAWFFNSYSVFHQRKFLTHKCRQILYAISLKYEENPGKRKVKKIQLFKDSTSFKIQLLHYKRWKIY